MKLLLDTHIWLWSLLEPERLSPNLLGVLRDSENELCLSPISIWELTILVSKNRIELNCEVDAWVTDAMSRAPIREIPLTVQAALEANSLDLPHRDPADRFLVATARTFDLRLVTADRRLLAAGLCQLFPGS